MILEELDDLVARLSFGEEDLSALRALYSFVEPDLDDLADEFYAAVLQTPEAPLLLGQQGRLLRVRQSFRDWISRTLSASRDAEYLRFHARIAAIHEQLHLPRVLVLSSMARLRSSLAARILRTPLKPQAREQTLMALGRALDLEIAILLTSRDKLLAPQVERQERLAELGALTSSLAHDLRNPLGTLTTSLFLAQKCAASLSAPDLDRHLTKMGTQLDLCANIVSSILDLARGKPPRRKRIPLLPLVKDALETVALPPAVTLQLTIEATLTVSAEPTQLRQLLVNLLMNAGQAAGPTGRVWIEAQAVADGTVLWVRDNGPGVSEENRQTLFDPLFTQKAEGIGLGLYLCRQIAEAHGGSLLLEPTQTGASFKTWLPDPEIPAPVPAP